MKKNCNICKKKFINFLNLGNHPCGDTFLKSKMAAKNLKKTPLVVGYCSCSHLTALYPVSNMQRYQKYDYSYTASNSPVSRIHFKKIAKQISKIFKLNSKSFVLEAGSNDGTFLSSIKKYSKAKILGIDPSKNMCKLARKKGIITICDFFSKKSSKVIAKKFGYADIFYGANVFNHVENNLDFLDGAYKVLKDSGILILEVPDLYSLIKTNGFDTIYHEHRHYYSEKSIKKILELKKFKILKIDKINYMSGSIRIFASKNIHKSNFMLNKKSYITLSQFKHFKKNVFLISKKIKLFVEEMNQNKEKVYGIGAATKGNTLLNFCKLNDKKIAAIIDSSPYKINKYTPGSAIKIVAEKNLKKIKKFVILPWNITDYLLKKFKNKKNISYISISNALKF